MKIQIILTAVICVILGFFFSYIRRAIANRIKVALPTTTPSEPFQLQKFLKGFAITDPVLWTKSIFEILDIRKLIIYAIIACSIWGYGYWRGLQNVPVNVEVAHGKEVIMVLNGEQLHIDKEGNVFLEDTKTGKIIKQIKVKDISNLKGQLSAFGLQLKPFVMAGGSVGTDTSMGLEVGAGVSFFRAWKVELDAFITTHPAIYVGASYVITDSSGVGIAVGKSLNDLDDTRIILYYKWKF